ncbi:thioredoxin family protein [Lutibacter sp.]|uniref:thioredoxin family protein n=1 Tax=Lutibacter sp. TaxID=1925666 RepID=UPI003562AA47
MKKITTLFWVFLLLIPLTAKSNTSNWMTSLEDAQKLSKLLNKPILVDFWAIWCGPCKKMDTDVWEKEDIKLVMENYIPVKIDIDSNPLIATKYGVRSIPNIMILDSWGNVLESFVGYRDKTSVAKTLKAFTLNLAIINQALFILKKDEKNPYSNLRVAQKYQDASLVLENDSKNAFIKQSNSYLKSARKVVEKENTEFLEKVELLEVLNKAYFKSYKPALKKLEDFSNVCDANKALYFYIKYYCHYFLVANDEMEADKKELLNASANDSFVQKIEFLVK